MEFLLLIVQDMFSTCTFDPHVAQKSMLKPSSPALPMQGTEKEHNPITLSSMEQLHKQKTALFRLMRNG